MARMSAPLPLPSVLLSAFQRVLGYCALISIGIFFASEWRAREKNGIVEFSPKRIANAASIVIALDFADLTIGLATHIHRNPLDLTSAVFAGLGALILLFSIPEALIVSPEGLRQVYWLRPNKFIPWAEIVEINTGKKTKLVTILAANGTKILYRGGIANRPLLLSMIKRYCGENLPPDFPREPL